MNGDVSESETDEDNDEALFLSVAPAKSVLQVQVNMAETVSSGTRDVLIDACLSMNMRALLSSITPRTLDCISDVGADITILGDR
jgi:hypothetical protein